MAKAQTDDPATLPTIQGTTLIKANAPEVIAGAVAAVKGATYRAEVVKSVLAVLPAVVADRRIYLIRVRLGETDTSGWVVLAHQKQFKEAELAAMTAEAANFINTVRIPHWRAAAADQKLQVPDPVSLNKARFADDAEAFKGYMCDKFDFRQVLCMSGETALEPAAKF